MSETPLAKTDEQWRAELTPEQYDVLRKAGTEAPFTGTYVYNKDSGSYRCAGCGAELFTRDAKFESGTGWPSFTEPAVAEAVRAAARQQPLHAPHRGDLPRTVAVISATSSTMAPARPASATASTRPRWISRPTCKTLRNRQASPPNIGYPVGLDWGSCCALETGPDQAGGSPVRVSAGAPGSRPRLVVVRRRAERGVESLFGGSKRVGCDCSLVTFTMGEPSRSCHGEGHVRQSWFRIGRGGSSAGYGKLHARKVWMRDKGDPSVQPRQQRPFV